MVVRSASASSKLDSLDAVLVRCQHSRLPDPDPLGFAQATGVCIPDLLRMLVHDPSPVHMDVCARLSVCDHGFVPASNAKTGDAPWGYTARLRSIRPGLEGLNTPEDNPDC